MKGDFIAKAHMGDVEVNLDIMDSSYLAVLVTDGYVKAWLPKSEINWVPGKPGDNRTIEMPEWLAEEKGLI